MRLADLLKNKWFLVVICTLGIVGGVFHYWRTGGFLHPQGTILRPGFISQALPWEERFGEAAQSHLKLYKFDLATAAFQEYFADPSYTGIGFPVYQGSSLLVTVRHKEKGYFTVLQVSGNKAEELITARGQITYAVFANPQELILVMAEPQIPVLAENSGNYHLFRYQMKEKKLTQLYGGRLFWNSRPMLSPTGSIFFSADGWIKELLPSGQVKNWMKGEYPFWLEEGKRFFYANYEQRTLNLVDVATGEEKIIVRNTGFNGQPVLSPDKKLILYREFISPKSGEAGLRILSVDGWVKKQLTEIERSTVDIGPARYQLEWLPEAVI